MTPKECERIYNEAYRAVYWTAISLLKNEADAQDVVQETFVTLLESYDSLQDKTKVVPWLKKICANKCLNLLSRTRTEAVEQEFFEDAEFVPEDFLPESIVESEEKRKIIMDIIGKALSDDVRNTIILYYFDEMSTKEIAEAMGIPQGTVLWRLAYARKKIKKEVERYEKETNTKLYTVALPFLALLFKKEAEQVPLRPIAASLVELSASKAASMGGAESTVASAAIEKGTGIVMKKLIIYIITLICAGAAGVGIYFALTKEDDDSSRKNRKDPEHEITVTVTEAPVTEEPDMWSDEYWLARMLLIDVNDEATIRKLLDVLMTCEPKLGENKYDVYDKVVGAIGMEPLSYGTYSYGETFVFDYGIDPGYSGYDRLLRMGYSHYATEPCYDIDDPAKVIAYEDNISNPTRKGYSDIAFKIYDEARAQKLYQFCCDYVTEYYAQNNPPVEIIGNNYFLKCGDGGAEYYAYARLLHKDENDYWYVEMGNCFADPELMEACEQLKNQSAAE
ncbi:MAG: sigma-70 family RNA polymerase sigma factor [Lachnospiraceae bacterium]|nr:sigma-70 family RNA polymerase sigma factor [Lachnospiraceae bacterium]